MRSITAAPDAGSRTGEPGERGETMDRRSARTQTWTGFALAAACLALAAPPALAADAPAPRGDAAKGKSIAAEVCAPCHNADGNSTIPTNPKLAGQSAAYLVKQLADLVKPATDKTARENPVMGAIASSLAAGDRLDVAAWFASQSPWAPAGAAGQDLHTGQRLYRAGIPEKAVPACAGCHGPAGNGLPNLYPRIGGQHGDYVEAQLRAFRDGSRHNNEAMGQIAFRLSDPEIKALSDYVAALRAQP
jgi:cytochrome c553